MSQLIIVAAAAALVFLFHLLPTAAAGLIPLGVETAVAGGLAIGPLQRRAPVFLHAFALAGDLLGQLTAAVIPVLLAS